MKKSSSETDYFAIAALLDAVKYDFKTFDFLDKPILENLRSKYKSDFETARRYIHQADYQPQIVSEVLSPLAFKSNQPHKQFYIPTQKLNIKEKCLYPSNKKIKVTLQSQVAEFYKHIAKIKDTKELLTLIETYLTTLPIDNQNTGINLCDYAHLSAALAVCTYKNTDETKPALLVKGDISGIQDFIFDVVSKGAAKSLKSRSYRVQALALLAVEYILNELELPYTNLIFIGGGNFYLLVPKSQEAALYAAQKNMLKDLLEKRDGLHINMASVDVAYDDFKAFSSRWEAVEKALNKVRYQRFKGHDFDVVFGAMLPNSPIAEREKKNKEYTDFTEKLNDSKGYDIQVNNSYDKDFVRFNYSFEPKTVKKLTDEATWFNLKDDSKIIQNGKIRNNVYAVKDLPKWDKEKQEKYSKAIEDRRNNDSDFEEPKDGRLIEFGYLADFAKYRTGTDKLGILKMDVDNLGKLFQPERSGDDEYNQHVLAEGKRSLAHAMAVSRAFKWFFEGYMNTLLDKPIHIKDQDDITYEHLSQYTEKLNGETFRNNIYVIFSGGDDFFLVGAWDVIMEFAYVVRKEFKDFTEGAFSFSAGLVLVDGKFPVRRFSALADDAEKAAKSLTDGKGNELKDNISVFGTVLHWDDYAEARDLAFTLYDLVTNQKEKRAVIQKILRSMAGYKKIYHEILHNKRVNIQGLYKLHYFLRTVGDGQSKEQKENIRNIVNDKILNLYDELFTNALAQKARHGRVRTSNPMLIAVAARWAEFLTRNKN